MTGEQVAYIDSLPESAVFQADGWVYLVQHQYRPGSYEVIECRHAFEEHWRRHTPKEYWAAPRRRMVFGHTHRRELVRGVGTAATVFNPGSLRDGGSYGVITIKDGHCEFSWKRVPSL